MKRLVVAVFFAFAVFAVVGVGSAVAAGPPQVLTLSPSTALQTGDTIQVLGYDFVAGSTQVSVGGTTVSPSNVTVNSSSQLTVTVPGGAAGETTVQVTTPNGSSDANALTAKLTYAPAVPWNLHLDATSPASATNPSSAAIRWSAPAVAGITGYTVFRDGNPIATTSAYKLNYFDTESVTAGAHSYTVTAQTLGSSTAASSPLSVTRASSAQSISSCSSQPLANGHYVLQSDLMTGSQPCLEFDGTTDVSLDCNNHKIDGPQTAGVQAVLFSGASNFSVIGCEFPMTGFSTTYSGALTITNSSSNGTVVNSRFGNPAGNDFPWILNALGISSSASIAVVNGVVQNAGLVVDISNYVYVGGNNIEQPAHKPGSAGIGFNQGSHNVAESNNIDGGLVDPDPASDNGTDDGVVAMGESDDAIVQNVMQNVWDCGFESTDQLANTLIANNQIVNARASGVCSYDSHNTSWFNNRVTGNNTSGVGSLFQIDAGDQPAGRSTVFMARNVFTGNSIANQYVVPQPPVYPMAARVSSVAPLSDPGVVYYENLADTTNTQTVNGSAVPLSVVTTGPAGQSAPAGKIDMVLDTTPPNVTISSPVNGSRISGVAIAGFTSLDFSGSGILYSTCELRDTTTNTVVQNNICNSGDSYSNFIDGHNYTLTVTARDIALNQSSAATSFTYDTTPPNVAIANPANGAQVDVAPTLSFTATDPNGGSIALTQCKIEDLTTTTTVSDQTCASGTTLAGLTNNHNYRITVTATDSAGNAANAVSNFSTHDVTAPVVSITSPGESSYQNVPLLATFTATDVGGSGVVSRSCLLTDVSTNVIVSTGACVSPKTYSSLTHNHEYVLQVSATDAAGNTGSASVDFFASITPVVNIQSPTPGGYFPVATVTPVFSLNETATTTCSWDGGAFTACTSGHNGHSFAAGTHSLTVNALDSNGNAGSASVSFTVDPMVITITFPTSGAALNTSSVTPQFSAQRTIHIESINYGCSIDGGDVEDCDPSSPPAYTGLTDGSHTITITASDSYGPSSLPRSFTVDTTPPAAPVISTPAGNITTSSTTPTIAGTAEANSSVTVYDGATSLGTVSANGSGAWTFTPGSALSNAAHTITAKAKDAATNVSAASAARVITVDTIAPAVAISAPANGSTTTNTTPTLTFSATDATTHTELCKLDSGSFAACPATLGPLAAGSHTETVQSTDAAGNVGVATSTFTVLNAELRNIVALPAPSTTEDLTAQGDIDWRHWGRAGTSLVGDQKSSGGSQISSLTAIPSNAVIGQLTTGVAPTVQWSDGATGSGQSATGNTATGLMNTTHAIANGFSLTVSNVQNTEAMTLRLHVGVVNCTGKLELFWSSNPSNIVSDATSLTSNSSTAVNGVFSLDVRPPQASDTLNVRWTQATDNSTARVRIYSASLTKVGYSRATAPTSATLATDGTPPLTNIDWAHWGGTAGNATLNATPVGKSGATAMGSFVNEGTGTLSQATATTNPVSTAFTWSGGDAAPTSGTNEKIGLSNAGTATQTGKGFSFTVPADTTTMRTLKLYVGVTNTSTTTAQPVQLELFWGASSIPVVADIVPTIANGTANYVYTINLRHPSAAANLKVKWSTRLASTSYKATIQSAVFLQN